MGQTLMGSEGCSPSSVKWGEYPTWGYRQCSAMLTINTREGQEGKPLHTVWLMRSLGGTRPPAGRPPAGRTAGQEGRGSGFLRFHRLSCIEARHSFLKTNSPLLPTSPEVSPAAALPKERSISRWYCNRLSSREGTCSAPGEGPRRQAGALTWKVLDKGVVESRCLRG